MNPDSTAILNQARACLQLEAQALMLTAESLDAEFVQAVESISRTIVAGGKLIFTGVGKNVPVCLKLTGTFNSTGVPSIFLDPNQALHGDLGLCAEGDLAFLFSNSGETEDLVRIIPFLKRLGVNTIAVTSVPRSSIAAHCAGVLTYRIEQEACPLQLAPTSSIIAALGLGDALAMVYMNHRGFTKEDFAKFHPAGSLGKVLLLRVSEIMRTGDRFACLPETVTVQEAILAITEAKCGTIALTVRDGDRLSGVFTDGDFRRAALRDPMVLRKPVCDYMTRNPTTITASALAVEALRIFEKRSINDLIAVDDAGRPLGLLDGQDIPRLKLV